MPDHQRNALPQEVVHEGHDHLADNIYTEVLWTLDPSTNFKIARVDVYSN